MSGHDTIPTGAPFTLEGAAADLLAIEPGLRGALVRLRRRSDAAFLSAGDQGGAIAWSGEARDWETFLAIDLDTIDAIARFGARRTLPHGSTEPIAAGGVRLAPGFGLAVGGTTLPIAAGLSAVLLGDDDTPRLLLAIADRPASPILLSSFEAAVVWRHDGSDTADEEIALGLVSLRLAGGFRGRVFAAVRDRPAIEAALVRAGLEEGVFDPIAVGSGTLPAEIGAGPILILANGVFSAGPVAPLLAAAASATGPLAAPWRRIGEDPFGPAGRTRIADEPPDRVVAMAVEPAIIALSGSARDRRLRDAVWRDGATTDGELAERFRSLALASGAPVDATALDRFVASWRPDRDHRPLAPLVNARPLPGSLRLAAIRNATAGSRS